MLQTLFLFISLLFSSSEMQEDKRADKSLRILFVGNSLTYVNDLPAIVAELGKQEGVVITYTSYLLPDYSLEDHWNEGKVKTEIEKGVYDFVVAQQGPSARPESQVLLIDYAQRLADICKKNKSKLALYMVWPSKARSFDFDNVIKSYTLAAQKTASLLCPAGLGWKYAWQADANLPLYSADDFHPSISGSVLAALTIYASIANKKDFDFIQYSKSSWKSEIPEERLLILKEAAAKALQSQ